MESNNKLILYYSNNFLLGFTSPLIKESTNCRIFILYFLNSSLLNTKSQVTG